MFGAKGNLSVCKQWNLSGVLCLKYNILQNVYFTELVEIDAIAMKVENNWEAINRY